MYCTRLSGLIKITRSPKVPNYELLVPGTYMYMLSDLLYLDASRAQP